MIEVTQGTPHGSVHLNSIMPGHAFFYQGKLYLKVKHDAAIVELGDNSEVADFDGSNPMVTPVRKLEITWYT